MEDEKKGLFVFTCPNCSETASPMYTKRELETAIEEGEISVFHIKCHYPWKQELSSQEKEYIKQILANW